MDVEAITHLPNRTSKWKRENRCSRIVRMECRGNLHRRTNRCQRMSQFKLDGIGLCKQHAGEAALNHLHNRMGVTTPPTTD